MKRWKRELITWLLSEIKALLAEEPYEPEDDYDRWLLEIKGMLERMDIVRHEPLTPPLIIPGRPLFAMLDERFNAVKAQLQQVTSLVQRTFFIDHSRADCSSGQEGVVMGLIEGKRLKLICQSAKKGVTEEWEVDHILR